MTEHEKNELILRLKQDVERLTAENESLKAKKSAKTDSSEKDKITRTANTNTNLGD